MNYLIMGLKVLLAAACVALLYWVTIWVLDLIGVRIPEKILTIGFVVLGLMAVIGVLTGRFDKINA